MDRLDALLAQQALEHLPRTGWCQRGISDPESVAAHAHGVALVALTLVHEVAPTLDAARVLAMAIVHDAPEALLGDLPRTGARLLPEGAKREAERRAADELLRGEPRAAFDEYAGGATREARFVKACDGLQLGLRLLAYRRSGRRGLEEFEDGLRALDATEFAPAEALRRELVAALEALA